MALVTVRPFRIAASIIAGACLAGIGASAADATAFHAAGRAIVTPRSTCGTTSFAYAGEYNQAPAPGIEADLTALASPTVPYGHVAAWIGVGGPNAGPKGQQDWIQAGLDTVAGAGSELYAEIAQPGHAIQHVTLATNVAPGSSYQLAVVRVANRPNVWQVTLGGAPATPPVYLPKSGGFQPMAMSESWNGGQAACNDFSYRFDGVHIAGTTGGWLPLTDPGMLADTGFHITDKTAAGFTAGSE